MTPVNPKISVVVVAYKAESKIKRCLDSLINQSYPKEKCEIIVVVDDIGTYTTIKDYPFNIYFREKKGSIPSARNAGINLSKGEIVAFTDSDCVVDTHWLDKISSSFQSYPNVSAVGGPIKPYGTDPVSLCLAMFNMVGYSGGDFSHDRQFPTSNAAYKKYILDKIGGFDEKALVGEDLDLYRRLKKSGYSTIYNPNVIVYHDHRTNIRKIFLWCYSSEKRMKYITKKYKQYKDIFRHSIPIIFVLFYVAATPFLIMNNMFISVTISLILVLYFYLVLKFYKCEFFNFKALIIAPFVVLVICTGFLMGNISSLTMEDVKNPEGN